MENNNQPTQYTSPQENTRQTTFDSVLNSLGPKDDKYVNFLKANKNAIGSEIGLVFSGKFGWVAAGAAITAGLALRYVLQASSQYKIDLPVIDYATEKSRLFFKNFGNSIMSLFNCAEAICDFINFAARKKVAAIMKQKATQLQGTDAFVLGMTANEISRKASNKLLFWDLPQTILLLWASGIWNSPDQRLMINGINTALEAYERHKYWSSVFYYLSQLAKAAHGRLILGSMTLLTLMSTFNNLMNDMSKLSRNSTNLTHLQPHFEYTPASDTYRTIGTAVEKTDQLAFKKVVRLNFTEAKILAKSAKYFNNKLVYIYDIQIPWWYDNSLRMDMGSKYHRVLSGRELWEWWLEILGDVVAYNVAQDERIFPEPQRAFDWLFDLFDATEPDYSPYILVSKSEHNNLFKN